MKSKMAQRLECVPCRARLRLPVPSGNHIRAWRHRAYFRLSRLAFATADKCYKGEEIASSLTLRRLPGCSGNGALSVRSESVAAQEGISAYQTAITTLKTRLRFANLKVYPC